MMEKRQGVSWLIELAAAIMLLGILSIPTAALLAVAYRVFVAVSAALG